MKFLKLSAHVVLMLCICYLSSSAQTSIQKIDRVSFDPAISQLMEQPNDEPLRAILTFASAEEAKKARTQLQERHTQLIGPKFDKMPVQGVYATVEELTNMTDLPGIIGVWKDQPMSQELHQAVVSSSVHDVWEDSEFMALNGGLKIEGNGVGVLVNDSGFDGLDSDIQAYEEGLFPTRIVQNVRGSGQNQWVEKQFDNSELDPSNDTDQGGGHGSHCMGIIGGDGRHSNGKYKGVAPKAHLIGYGSGAGLFILDTGGGFEYCAQHAQDYNIRVMSNSFGSTADSTFVSFDPSHPTNVYTKTLTDMGVIVVFSAGNSGPNDGTITGQYKTAPWVITVGNGLKTGQLAGSSSRGRTADNMPNSDNDDVMSQQLEVGGAMYLWENRPSVTAPGTDIVAVRSTAGALGPLSASDDINIEPQFVDQYTTLTGTSMACPHVAGIVSLMVEANPNLEWRAAKAILQRTTIPMTEKLHQAGTGYVNAWASVAAAYNGLCDVGENATYDEKYGLATDGGFGLSDDPWKTCPLHPEVSERIKTTMPDILGVEGVCEDSEAPLQDAALDGPPQFDILEVRFHDETSEDFKISMDITNLSAVPPGELNSQNPFDVHFVLNKASTAEGENGTGGNTPDIVYIVQSVDILGTKQFRLTVKTADGTTRPSNTMSVELEGNWDLTNNTITWIVPKDELNVSATPEGGATPVERLSRAAQAGDRLMRWEAYTYNRPGTITPDGPGVYNDDAKGTCTKELTVR